MPLDPQLAAMLAAAPKWPKVNTLTVEQLRSGVRSSTQHFPKLAVPLKIEDRTIPGAAGTLAARVYTPEDSGSFPVIVYFHGGGWVVGDLDTQDMIARGLAHGAGAVVLSVDYRLAPEHPFPAAAEDAWAATVWASKNTAALRGNGRLAVAGDSAGGNLAAGVALRARDSSGPQLAAQVIFYGSGTYPAERTPSSLEFAEGPILCADDVAWFWQTYLGDPAKHQNDLRASPERAASLEGVAPAYVGTAEIDPSRDDCERFGAKLRNAGVDVFVRRYAGMVHGFVSWLGILPGAQTAVDDACTFLKARFAS